MKSPFTAAFFAGNRARLRQKVPPTTPIVISAHLAMQRSADTTFPFQQDNSFWYLTGVDEPNVVLVMDRDEEYLILPQREAVMELFDGATVVEELQTTSGITTVLHQEEGWKRLTARLKRSKKVATLTSVAAGLEKYGIYANPARDRLISRLQEVADLDIADIRPELMHMRMIKQSEELKAIRQAIAITAQTLMEVIDHDRLDEFAYEYELEAQLSAGYRSRDARGHAFDPIVASGKNACTIHYIRNESPLRKGQMVLVDTGAEWQHYAADISRTVIKGEPTKRQQAVHDAVRQATEYGIAQLKPGVSFAECEKRVRTFVGEKLCELGLVKSPEDEKVRHYYPHSPHYLGLDVHDVGDYQVPLAPGMVLTIEPGIYIPEEGIGVRIEDDIVITENGHDVLSKRLSRDLLARYNT